MIKFSEVAKVIGYSFGTAVAASLAVLLAGLLLCGFQLTESEGRIVGAVGTIAGIAGAAVGLWLTSRARRQAVK